MLDAKGVVQTWNGGAARIKGYRAEEIVGQHFSTFYPLDARDRCSQLLSIAGEEGRVEDEGWRVRKDGSRFWASVVITCLRDPDGNVVGYAKVTRDLTARRQSEEELRVAHERFRLLVEAVQDYAIFMLDPQGRVTTWDIGAERIKGYAAAEILGHHFSQFYPEADVRSGKCEMLLAVAAREGRVEDEGWRVRKDGHKFWANAVITALRDGAGKLLGFAKITRDLSERRLAEERVRELAEKARARVQALARLSEALAATTSVAQVGAAVIAEGAEFAHADTCTLYLLNPETRDLELVAERGCNPAILERVRRIGQDSGNPVYSVVTGEVPEIFVETAAQYDQVFPTLARANVLGSRARAFWAVPLVAEAHPIGLLGVGFHTEQSFTPEDRDFIATFARQCAQALARAQRLDSERAAAARAERLRASLETTLRSIGDAVIATDANGEIVFMNGVAETLTGWKEQESRGRPLAEVFRIVNEHTRAIVASPVDQVLRTGGVVGLANHTVLLARDGREIAIDDSGAPIRAHGNLEGVVLVFRDVTERRAAELRQEFLARAGQTLAESLDYETTVSRVARLAVPVLADWCAVDLVVEGERLPRRLAVTHVDPAKVELAIDLNEKYPPSPDAPTGVPAVLRTGRSELYPLISEEVLAASSADAEQLRIARDLKLHSAMIVPLALGERTLGAMSFIYAESRRTYNDDDLRFAEDLARRCAQAIQNAKLFSSEQSARRNADLANRAKDEFLAVVSHELRNPLNAIMGWAKLLSTKNYDEQPRQRALATIERNAVAMAQLIEDLLDMSRVISGKMRLEVQPIEVPLIVEAALDAVRPAATAKSVEVRSLVDATASKILGDPMRIQQVIWNLLNNAVKFTPKGGRVEVVVRRVDSAVEIMVADNGQGISPAFLPHVFDPFRQEESGAARTRSGLGLGLAITRQLVELHGGRISAHSDGQGHGATFVVSLPVSVVNASLDRTNPEPGPAHPARPAFERPVQLQGLRVLVVDDESDARMLIATILEDCGSKVTTAGSVHEALELFLREPPDVVLSDIGMPGEDGFALIRKIRALSRDRGGDVPAAAITAYARAEDRLNLLNAGFSIHLPKPIDPAELVAVVTTLSRFITKRS
jgi:PAS domain S-box-containing protein